MPQHICFSSLVINDVITHVLPFCVCVWCLMSLTSYVLKHFFFPCWSLEEDVNFKALPQSLLFFSRQLFPRHLCNVRGMLNNLFRSYTGVPSGGIKVSKYSEVGPSSTSSLGRCITVVQAETEVQQQQNIHAVKAATEDAK